MMFYTGDLFPEWKGNLFVGAMPGSTWCGWSLNGERIVAEEKLLTDLKQRDPRRPPGPGRRHLRPGRRQPAAAEAETLRLREQ